MRINNCYAFVIGSLFCVMSLHTHTMQAQESALPESEIMSSAIVRDSVIVRPVTSAVTIGLGNSKARNTYLSTLLYQGSSWNVSYERWRNMRHPRWTNEQILSLTFSANDNASNTTKEYIGRGLYRYALHYNFVRNNDWTLMAGPYANSELGFDYNLKLANSNNPTAARAVTNVGASLAAFYHYRLRNQPCLVRLQAQMPFMGFAFMPDYGASYYETFLLDSGGSISHFTSLHNEQDLDFNLVTDIPLAAISWFKYLPLVMRIGYQYHIETMKINDITARYSSHSFVIGWVYQYLPYRYNRRNMVRGLVRDAY